MLDQSRNGGDDWRLRGIALQVAVFAAVFFVAAAVLAVAVDRYAEATWDSPRLQAWTLVPQVLVAAGLIYLGRLRRSRAFWILGGLVVLIVIEEAFHVLNPVANWLGEMGQWTREWTNLSFGGLGGAAIYVVVAALGFGGLAAAYWHGSMGERRIVRRMTLLLVVGGLFGGPVSVLSSVSGSLNWQTVEEFGEAVVFAVMAGYVAGLVATVRVRGSNDPRSASAGRGVARRGHP